MTADLPTIRIEQMFSQQRALEERVRIENYASKGNDFRTCEISKVLFLTESEITVVAKELNKTSNQSRLMAYCKTWSGLDWTGFVKHGLDL